MPQIKNERGVKQAIKEEFGRLYPGMELWHFMPAANGYGRHGIPDIIGTINGHFFAIETKFGGNKLSAHQEREIRKLKQSNSKVWVVNEKNLDEWKFEFAAWAASCL